MRFVGGGLLLVAALSGCASAATPDASKHPSSSVSSRVIPGFELYTHCGVREARIGNDFYYATPVLDDGSGNPPRGWGNPYQTGTMTLRGDGTAHFASPSGLEAVFRLRPGASTWTMICS